MAKDEDHGDTARRVITITIILLLLLLTIPKLPILPKKGPDTTTDPDPDTTVNPDPTLDVVADPNPDTVEDPNTTPDTPPSEIPDPSTPPTEIPTPEPPESPVVVPPLPFPVDVPYPSDGEIPAITGSGAALPLGIGDAFLYGALFAIPFIGPVIEPIIVGLGSLFGGGNILPAPAQVIRSPAQAEQV